MFKFLLFSLVLLFIFLPSNVFAANEFSSSYKVNYSVGTDGVTQVTEEIKLKNLTEKFFPSSFSVVLPGNSVTDVQATDAKGFLEVNSFQEGSNTKLTVKFTNQQIIGLNKEYAFKLSFKDNSIARNLGKSWMVNIPKLTQGAEITGSTFTLSVPTSFGDPDYISPPPVKTDEVGGRINFTYDEKSFFNSGVTAVFGRELDFSFAATYELKNDSIFPKFQKIPLPADSPLQKSFIETLNPVPENTETDSYGNTFAVYKLNPAQSLRVTASGEVKTLLTPEQKELLSVEQREEYLKDGKYWDTDNPAIRNKLSEVFALANPQTNFEKAREIDRFVSNFLRFNESRLAKKFERFGSVTALNNPEQALAAEFVDLEVALLRSAGIPARQVVGFSLGPDKLQGFKPYSFQNNKLHTWVEFYDDERGWVISDPAWENTTKGVNFFAFNDLTHIKLVNADGVDYFLPSDVNAEVYQGEMQPRSAARFDVEVSPEILSGFPSKAKVRITNLGNTSFPESELKIDTAKILLSYGRGEPSITETIKTPAMPPFGNLEYELNLKTGAIWHSYQDVMQVTFSGVTDTKVLSVVPVLSYKVFAIEIAGAFIIIALFYVVVFLVHHKTSAKA
jgi:hypothetical protein